MAYITKTDIKVLFKTFWEIGQWALRGFNPMEPMEDIKDKLVLDRESLWLGKYTRGFDKLSSEQLEGLLWLIGEWSVRSSLEDPMGYHPRSKAAFKAMLEFKRKPLTREEAMALMRESVRSK